MKSKKVSVVVAAYNAAVTLDATLGSVLNQSVPADEVIVADDSSTDDTVAIAKRWLDLLPLKIIERPRNGGVGEARASAINAASHDIIAPLDADDIWLPDHLETTVALMTDESVIVATRPVRWAPGLGLDSSGVGLPPSVPSVDDQVKETILNNFLFVGSLYSKRALDRAGGPGLLSSVEDWDGWIRLVAIEGCRAVSSPHATVLYRSRTDSVSAGEACLPAEAALLTSMLNRPEFQEHKALLTEALRRRRSRAIFLEAVHLSSSGFPMKARRKFFQALIHDPSLRGGAGPGAQGSVAVRSAVGLVSPAFTNALRNRRLERKRILQPEREAPTSRAANDSAANQKGTM